MKLNKKERLAAKAAATSTKAKNVEPATKEVKKKKVKAVSPEVKDAKAKAIETLNGAAAVNTTKKITEVKDLKYKYPEEVDNLAERKKFRAEVRRKVAAFEKEIAKLQNAEDKPLLDKRTKEINSYLKKVYTKA